MADSIGACGGAPVEAPYPAAHACRTLLTVLATVLHVSRQLASVPPVAHSYEYLLTLLDEHGLNRRRLSPDNRLNRSSLRFTDRIVRARKVHQPAQGLS